MKTKSLLVRVLVSVSSTSLLLVLAACGGGSDEQTSNAPAAGAVYTPTTAPYGNFNVKCDQSPAQQVQQKVPYQQQQQSGGSCSPQFQFYSAVATDFDVNLDCRNGQVIVVGKGIVPTSTAIPTQSDGTWNGQVVVDQSVENDGQGNIFCKVRTIVNFNGNATCNSGGAGKDGLTWATTVHFASASNSSSMALLALEASLPPATSENTPENASENNSGNAPGISAEIDPSPTPSGTPLSTPSSSVEAGEASPVPSASPSSSPAATPSTCVFSDSQTVNSSTLNISIPEGAADLGCSAFGERVYTIASGTKVTWTNDDTQPHTVTADEESSDSFDSGAIRPGQKFSHVFNRVGTFKYHSTLDANMQGQLTVEQVAVPSPTALPLPTPTATATAVPPVVVLPGTTPTASPSPSPSSSASPSASPSPSPSPSPGPSPSTSPSASPSPSPSVSPSASPSISPSPGTTPSPSATQIVSCVVVNPCPIYAQTSQSCPSPAQQ